MPRRVNRSVRPYNSDSMSLITRCPACGTMFKVVPDQLKISEGWVRCGHCAVIFDASVNMQASPDPPAVEPAPDPVEHAFMPPPYLPDDMRTPAVQDAYGNAAALPLPQSQGNESVFGSLDETAPLPIPGAAPAWLEQPAVATDAMPLTGSGFPTTDIAPLRGDDGHDLSQGYASVPDTAARADEGSPDAADRASEDASPSGLTTETAAEGTVPVEDVSFVREAQRKAFWRRPAVRAGLIALAVLLLTLLALQVGLRERDRLAALYPAAKPALQALCGLFECAVRPFRQIESIVIDSSSFNKVREDVYRLNLVVKNTAPLGVAMPAIELALTDTRDQPVVRRVLTAEELGAVAVLAPGAEWSGSLPISVAASANPSRIAGYRVLAFYP